MRRILGGALLAIVAAGATYGAIVTGRERSYREMIQQGDAALARDDSYAAIEAFSVAISLKEDSMAAHLKRGEAYRRRQQFASARRDLRRAAELDTVSPYPRELLGDVHYGMGSADSGNARTWYLGAMESYREALALDDRAARIQYKLGLAAFRAGQHAAAIEAARQAVDLDPALAEAHYLLGVCQRATQQTRSAVRALERAIALSPGLIVAHEELADVYGDMGRHEDRLKQLRTLAELDPAPARDRALGLAYARAGQLQQALSHFGHARDKYPDDQETFLAVGRLWLQRAADGDRVELNKALQALGSAIAPTSSSEAYTLYGRALLLAGDAARAERMFNQAVVRFPVQPEAYLHLADLSARNGRRSAAHRAIIDYAALVRTETLSVGQLLRLAEAQLASGRRDQARRTLVVVLERDPQNDAALDLQARASASPASDPRDRGDRPQGS